jgi:hypothetical protein
MRLRSMFATVAGALRRVWERRGRHAARTADRLGQGKAQRDSIADTAGTRPPPTFPGQFR